MFQRAAVDEKAGNNIYLVITLLSTGMYYAVLTVLGISQQLLSHSIRAALIPLIGLSKQHSALRNSVIVVIKFI
jgi:hypothetical protein